MSTSETSDLAATPKPEIPKSKTPKRYQAIVPADHPPYEEPMQLQYGGHFDNSVKHKDAYEDQSPGYFTASRMEDEFEDAMRKIKAVAHISCVTAITSVARLTGGPSTPPYFAITIYEPFDFGEIRDIAFWVIK
ncbi:hypothetical protein HII31_00025 [Pseudocercospora fuligena]|uniref:Uncharacterized protein n=1 Tax=Pseudocercospora fuligena TaxID=685502 RepID=A0A8H6RTU2_9PEZI|nr:hypothetical protein HII31_00025 [Pseudocercospora fuligena]